MSMQGVLIARALVWFLIGIAMFVSLSYQTPEEKKAGKREKKTRKENHAYYRLYSRHYYSWHRCRRHNLRYITTSGDTRFRIGWYVY